MESRERLKKIRISFNNALLKSKRLRTLISLFCILSTQTLASSPSIPENQFSVGKITYQQLKNLYNSGQQEQAILSAQIYLKQYPKDADIRLALGEFYFFQKKYNKGRLELIKGLQQVPSYLDIRLVLINTELALKQTDEALKITNEGLKLNPNQPELLKRKENIQNLITKQKEESKPAISETTVTFSGLKKLYASGKRKEAILQAQSYLKQYPNDSDIRLALGQFYLWEKQYEAARSEFTQALVQTPAYVDVRLALIETELALKKTQDALDTLNQGLQLNPNQSELLKKKKYFEALDAESQTAGKIVTKAKTPEYQRLRILYNSGKYKEAIMAAQTYLKETPKDGDVRLVLGQFYLWQKKYEEARKELKQALDENPNYLDVRLALVQTELDLKKNKEALDIVIDGLKLNADQPELLKKKRDIQALIVQNQEEKIPEYKRLQALYKSGKHKETILEAQNYLKKMPKDTDVRLVLGGFYLSEKQYEEARKELTQALSQAPDYLDVRLTLIQTELALKKPDEALKLVTQGLKLHPKDAELLKKKTTIQNFQKTEKRKEEEGSIFKHLRSLFDSGDHASAIHQAEDYLKRYPKDSDVRLALGGFYLSEKEYSQAREQLSKALLQTPNYLEVRLALINTELATKNYQEAFTLTQQGLAYNASELELVKKQTQIQNILQEEAKKNRIQEVGLLQQNYYVSDQKKVWDYSTLYYSTKTPIGRISTKLNYAERNGQRAYQGEFEYFPVINKYLYLDLDYAFAHNPNIFPNRSYLGEAYLSIPQWFDVSLGGRYNKIDDIHFFRTFTGSISKSFKNDRITFRPYYFSPGTGLRSVLNSFDFRHYINAPNHYIGFTYAAGLSPDLADLQTVGFIRLKNIITGFYWSFPLFNERLSVNLNVSYQHQIFPNQNIRNLIGGGIALAFHF